MDLLAFEPGEMLDLGRFQSKTVTPIPLHAQLQQLKATVSQSRLETVPPITPARHQPFATWASLPRGMSLASSASVPDLLSSARWPTGAALRRTWNIERNAWSVDGAVQPGYRPPSRPQRFTRRQIMPAY